MLRGLLIVQIILHKINAIELYQQLAMIAYGLAVEYVMLKVLLPQVLALHLKALRLIANYID